jgi:hypothetical protein
MSYITYNGVAMTLIQTKRWEQVPIKNGQDIAGFRYTCTVLANLNTRTLGLATGTGASTSAAEAGTGRNAARGMVLWSILRERLLAQRRPFQMAVGSIVIADVGGPTSTFPTDIELGPKPLACNAIQFNGGGSVLVEYTIQWAQPNPCVNTNGVIAVLAHVWGVNEDIDEDYFLTRTYQGRIQFDPRVAGPAGDIHPDSLRGALFPPIQIGFRRENIATRMSEDGFTFDYRLTDIQPYQLVNSTTVTRIVATHSLKQMTPTPKEYADAAASIGQVGASAFHTFKNERGARLRPSNKYAPVGRVQGIVNKAVGVADMIPFVGGAISAMWSAIPIATHLFETQAFGTNQATYEELARAARIICLWRLMKYSQQAVVSNWGGAAETVNHSEPRSVSFMLQVHSTPRDMATQSWQPNVGSFVNRIPGLAAFFGNPGELWVHNEVPGVWESGGNDMPTGPNMINKPITTPAGAQVPLHIRQLVYGATPGFGEKEWNGPDNTRSFAPELLSDSDRHQDGEKGQARPYWPNGSPGDEGLPPLCLIAALQNPCKYKVAVEFPAAGLDPVNNPQDLPGGK